MEQNFCNICGSKVTRKAANIYHCPVCNQDHYANAKPCVEIALFNHKGEVLLSERGEEPNKGKYDMPGGFVDLGENAETALLRELAEELTLQPQDLTTPEFVGTYLSDYVWGKEVYENLGLVFTARLKGNPFITPHDDVAGIKWVLPEKIDQNELCSLGSLEMIKRAVAKSQS